MEFIDAGAVFDQQCRKHSEEINNDLEIVFNAIYDAIERNGKDTSVTLEFTVSEVVQQKLESLCFQVSTFEFSDHSKTIVSWYII